MRKLFLLVFLIFFCSTFFIDFFNYKKEKSYLHIAETGLKELATKYANEFQLHLVASGGAFHGGLNGFVYRFNSPKPEFSIEKARLYYITIKEEMLYYVNSTKELRPYLISYPFPQEEFIISIGYPRINSPDEEAKEQGEGKHRIDFVFGAEGKIFYDSYSVSNRKFERIYEEDYEEAKRIVEMQKKKMEQNS